MKKSIYTFAIVFSIFLSCKRDFQEYNKLTIVDIKNKIEPIKLEKYSNIYDSIYFVKLETTNKSLIGRIDKIIIFDDKIIIMDQIIRKAVLMFNLKGKFIKMVGNNGKGPGEYDEPNDITINNYTKEIVIWCNNMRKIILYDFDGNFKKEFRIPYYPKCIAAVDKNKYALYFDYGRDINDPRIKENLYIINNKGKIVKTAFKIKDNEISKGGFYYFSQFDNDILISPKFSNTIYTLKIDSLIKKYKINFKKENTIPEDYIVKSFKEMNSTEYAYILKFFETQNHLIFFFVYKGLIYNCFYSKKTNKLKYGNVFYNDINGILGSTVMAVYKNFTVSYYDYENLERDRQLYKYPIENSKIKDEIIKELKNIEKILNNKVKINYNFFDSLNFKINKRDVEFINSLNSTDNPILLFGKLKSF